MGERRLMPVQVEVVKEALVERILAAVHARYPPTPAPAVARALTADLMLPACDGGSLDLRLRGVGYLTRSVERELFEPARQPLPGLAVRLAALLEVGDSWTQAVCALAAELAATEPLPKPEPSDERAVSWQVPGPGGHVRHYLVAAAIADALALAGPRERAPASGAAAELKRAWTYGFLVACCEEALAPEPPGARAASSSSPANRQRHRRA